MQVSAVNYNACSLDTQRNGAPIELQPPSVYGWNES